jgi:hypothetical protein
MSRSPRSESSGRRGDKRWRERPFSTVYARGASGAGRRPTRVRVRSRCGVNRVESRRGDDRWCESGKMTVGCPPPSPNRGGRSRRGWAGRAPADGESHAPSRRQRRGPGDLRGGHRTPAARGCPGVVSDPRRAGQRPGESAGPDLRQVADGPGERPSHDGRPLGPR